MSLILGGLERPLISALEPIVLMRAYRHVESFARNILQKATAGAVESRPAQRFAVTAAMTNAQPAVLPQVALRAEAIRGVNVGTEATGSDGSHSGRSPKELDLREGPGGVQHQQPRLLLSGHALIQHLIKLREGRAQVPRLYPGQHLLASLTREQPLASNNHSLHSQAGFDLGLQTSLLAGQLIVMLHQLFKVVARLVRRIMYFLETIQPQQLGQFESIDAVALVGVFGDPRRCPWDANKPLA
jgi:hypothetical protein